jgi:hypothetical protein
LGRFRVLLKSRVVLAGRRLMGGCPTPVGEVDLRPGAYVTMTEAEVSAGRAGVGEILEAGLPIFPGPMHPDITNTGFPASYNAPGEVWV